TVLVRDGADRFALRPSRKQMLGHRDPHLRGDIHVDVLVEALPAAGHEIVEAHQLVDEGLHHRLEADEIDGVAGRRAQDHALGDVLLAAETLRRQLPRAAPPEVRGGRRPDRVARLAGDVAEHDGLVRRTDLRTAVVPRLRYAVEG